MKKTQVVSTHSRPKAAGRYFDRLIAHEGFQLTAARRRLAGLLARYSTCIGVSTHSRPKAAGQRIPVNQ